MSARYAIGKVLGSLATLGFVVVFNFFLFRIVATDPVAVLFRGRNLSQSQREKLTEEFGLDGSQLEQFVRYVEQTFQLNFGRSYLTNRGVTEEIWSAMPATIALVGVATILSTLIGLWIGATAGWNRGTGKDRVPTSSSMVTWSMPDFWLGMLLLTFFAVKLDLFPTGGFTDPAARRPGCRALLDQAWHMALPCAHADARVPRRVRARDALLAARHRARGLPDARAGQGAARRRGPPPARRAERAAARSSA